MTTKQRIQFDTVQIREFPIILSNNPSCHYGPSIELGWEYSTNTSDETITVSQYEKLREGKRRTGRPSKFYLSQVRREAMLKDAGYTDREVKNAIKDKQKARRQRSLSKYSSVRSMIQTNLKASRTEKKVGRAVRNIDRINRKQKNGSELFYDKSAIYSGRWLPFSAHYF
jgi:hypothetical protein